MDYSPFFNWPVIFRKSVLGDRLDRTKKSGMLLEKNQNAGNSRSALLWEPSIFHQGLAQSEHRNNRALEVPRFHIGSLMPKHAKRQVDSQKGWRAPSEMGLMCQKPLLSKKNPKISEHGVWQNRLLAKEPFDTRHQSPSEISFALWYEAFFALPDFLCAARAFLWGSLGACSSRITNAP